MGKLLSFAILVLVTGAFGVLFFEVTAPLLLPLFLAMVSVVIFRPVHVWCVRVLGGRNRAAAVITTTLVLLVVVVPSVVVLLHATNEATKLVKSLDDGEVRDKRHRARLSLGLDYPHVVELRFAERSFEMLLADARQGAAASGIFIDDRPTAGIVLMIYGAGVISTIDNVIKPWVLHDRSAMHPLAALIGVLGGVQALGLIGVFVGPMVVAFLQTLLGLLHGELLVFDVKKNSQRKSDGASV